MGRINLAQVVSTCVFFFTLWVLQEQLSTLYEAVEESCGVFTCGRPIAVAYQLLSLSTIASALGVAYASYRWLNMGKE